MKKNIKLSLIGFFTLLIPFTLYNIGEDEVSQNRFNSMKNSNERFSPQIKNVELNQLEKNLDNSKKMFEHKAWGYDETDKNSTKENIDWSKDKKELLKTTFQKVSDWFSNLFNGIKVNKAFKTYSNSAAPNHLDDETKQAFKELRPDIQLKYINKFVEFENKSLEKRLNEIEEKRKEQENEIPTQKKEFDTFKLNKENEIYKNFNTRLNQFRQEINPLISEKNHHLLYNKKTKQFEFYIGQEKKTTLPTKNSSPSFDLGDPLDYKFEEVHNSTNQNQKSDDNSFEESEEEYDDKQMSEHKKQIAKMRLLYKNKRLEQRSKYTYNDYPPEANNTAAKKTLPSLQFYNSDQKYINYQPYQQPANNSSSDDDEEQPVPPPPIPGKN